MDENLWTKIKLFDNFSAAQNSGDCNCPHCLPRPQRHCGELAEARGGVNCCVDDRPGGVVMLAYQCNALYDAE